MKPLLIGLYSSSAQSGKSTAAHTLSYVLNGRIVKFAAPLKDMVRGLLSSMGFRYDTVERMIEGDLKEQVVPGFKTVTPRQLMQTLGTDWGREAVDQELWTKVGLMKAEDERKSGVPVIIDDMRFPNEFNAIKEAGGVTIRVRRTKSGWPVGDSRYEGLLDKYEFDHTLWNLSTLDDYRKRVANLGPELLHQQSLLAA